jgi:hypothetical protein
MYTQDEWKEAIVLTERGQRLLIIYTGESYENADEIIAGVSSFVGNCDGSEAEANFHLISAAPDMYEKLIKVNKWLDMLIKDSESSLKTCFFVTLKEAHEADIKNFKAIKADITNALNKAEGK